MVEKEERCESYWRRLVEKEKGVGLEERPLYLQAHCTHLNPVGPRPFLSIHILIAVSPFGDLSVRKRLKSLLLSLFLFFGGR